MRAGVVTGRVISRWCRCWSGARRGGLDDLPPGRSLSLASRSRRVLVGSAVCRNVPAGPVKVPRVSRSSSSAILAQVRPMVVSVRRMSSRASQHKMTWARIRSSCCPNFPASRRTPAAHRLRQLGLPECFGGVACGQHDDKPADQPRSPPGEAGEPRVRVRKPRLGRRGPVPRDRRSRGLG